VGQNALGLIGRRKGLLTKTRNINRWGRRWGGTAAAREGKKYQRQQHAARDPSRTKINQEPQPPRHERVHANPPVCRYM